MQFVICSCRCSATLFAGEILHEATPGNRRDDTVCRSDLGSDRSRHYYGNRETGAVYQTVSTPTGNYTLAQIPTGSYELSAGFSGFKKYVRSGVTVPVAQTLRIDIDLEIGAATESVAVEASAPLLKTESGEVSHNIETERLNSLPVLPTG